MNETEKDQIRRDYLNNLQHAIVAYRYLASSIPTDSMFVGDRSIEVGRFMFRTPANALSMRVELGWAFFVRLEAILEAFIYRLGIKLSRNKGLCDYLVESGVEFSKHKGNGLRVYREIRNTLHHGDGDPSLLHKTPEFLSVDEGHEPHLLKEHIELFFELFTWLGDVIPPTIQP